MPASFKLNVEGESLILSLSSVQLGFSPLKIWNPSPSQAHRLDPYPVPQELQIGVRPNLLTSAKFSPPPIAVVLEGAEQRWFCGVKAETGWHRWNEAWFEAHADGIRIALDLEGMTDPAQAAKHIQVDLIPYDLHLPLTEILTLGLLQQYPYDQKSLTIPEWWLRPIYCGWGDQVAFAMHQEGVGLERRAMAYCIQGLYERWINHLDQHDVPIGTVVVDGGWSLTGHWTPDMLRWPDLRGFIDRQHQAGRKVLLWLGTWLWDGLSEELSILGDGRQWTADPGHPDYQDLIKRWVTDLISPDGFDADGFKIDQLGFTPNRRQPRWCPRFGFMEIGDHPVTEVRQKGDLWGIELLHQYQKLIYQAAKAAKSDALVTSSTVHPYFRNTFDMVRLHDVGKIPSNLVSAMQARADLAHAALPGYPVDSDNWVHSNYDLWVDYTCQSPKIGVPCILYSDRFITNWREEPATAPIKDLDVIAKAWHEAGYQKPSGVSSASLKKDIVDGYQSE